MTVPATRAITIQSTEPRPMPSKKASPKSPTSAVEPAVKQT